MTEPRHNLLGLTLPELTGFMRGIGEPDYRGRQVFRWLYEKGVRSIGQMTDLGKAFRERLALGLRIEGVNLVAQQRSRRDGTTKFLFQLSDNLKVESVLIPPASAFNGKEAAGEDEQTRLTLCVSTQVGCPLDCQFCATGTMGFRRNLTTGEIVDQILEVKRVTGKKITNIVFMGMGEPLLNYDNLMNAVEIITTGIGIAARRITISTAGRADKIRQMADENRRPKLALSLHSAVDDTRTRLMPINKRYDLASLTSALEYYYGKTKQRVTYEVIFFDGINDSDRDVAQLLKFAGRVPCKINVIPFHSIDGVLMKNRVAALRPSPLMPHIVETLRSQNLTVMVRSSAGEDIDAACGQLAVKGEHRPPVRHNGIKDTHVRVGRVSAAKEKHHRPRELER